MIVLVCLVLLLYYPDVFADSLLCMLTGSMYGGRNVCFTREESSCHSGRLRVGRSQGNTPTYWSCSVFIGVEDLYTVKLQDKLSFNWINMLDINHDLVDEILN